ncbi:hypothetical protein AWJ14_05795 [Hoeflea olei]|uniref:Uncharacterized protein n=1 Tax=Hoeflea olei TaxID=1480615 RepID=A0A1C1YPS4_9HYPH|nr:hypothetical protein AWJ14_05795 [Hoeflea olei]
MTCLGMQARRQSVAPVAGRLCLKGSDGRKTDMAAFGPRVVGRAGCACGQAGAGGDLDGIDSE